MGPIIIITNNKFPILNASRSHRGFDSAMISAKQFGQLQDKPNVVDMNNNINFPINQGRKKNKNDFYRFLLQQNLSQDGIS